MRNLKRLTILMLSASLMAGCAGGLFKKKPKTPVLGDRVSVLVSEAGIEIDPTTAAMPMILPPAVQNDSWAQSGGNARKSGGHYALGSNLHVAWTASIGEGSSHKARLASGPVVADGKVFTVDAKGVVRAFNAQNGSELWSTRFGEVGDNGASIFGGGVAYDAGRLYATNGLGYVASLDPSNGAQAWVVHPGGPIRGKLSVADGSVYFETQDNQLYSLKTSDGSTNWTAAAALEIAGISGAAAPSIGQGTVVAGFSSGELNAYRYENGRMVWQDTLSRTSITTSVSALSDIDADAVIDSGVVYAVGIGGRMVALDLFTGQRAWELNFAGVATPWLTDDWLYAVNDQGQLVCVNRLTGKIKWINQLPRFHKPKKKIGPITYVGPVLAGDRLILAGSNGALINVNPIDGSFENQSDVKEGISFQPVVANNTLYILTDSGRLIAYR